VSQSDYYRGVETAEAALRAAAQAGPAAQARAVHDAMAPAFAATTAAPWLACRRGCDACCHLPVGVTFGEALRLLAAIDAEPGLAAQVDAAAAATAGVPWRELAGQPCPLLAHGACIVHGARPLPCRALGSRDAAACARGLQGRGDVPVDDEAFFRGLGAAASLAAAAEPAGTRELRSALAALRAAGPDGLAAAFLGARPVGDGDGG
jgi:hypothetical protein